MRSRSHEDFAQVDPIPADPFTRVKSTTTKISETEMETFKLRLTLRPIITIEGRLQAHLDTFRRFARADEVRRLLELGLVNPVPACPINRSVAELARETNLSLDLVRPADGAVLDVLALVPRPWRSYLLRELLMAGFAAHEAPSLTIPIQDTTSPSKLPNLMVATSPMSSSPVTTSTPKFPETKSASAPIMQEALSSTVDNIDIDLSENEGAEPEHVMLPELSGLLGEVSPLPPEPAAEGPDEKLRREILEDYAGAVERWDVQLAEAKPDIVDLLMNNKPRRPDFSNMDKVRRNWGLMRQYPQMSREDDAAAEAADQDDQR